VKEGGKGCREFGKAFCHAAWNLVLSLDPGFSTVFCAPPVPDSVETVTLIAEKENKTESIFRQFITPLGFLVGICWEKAFAEANEEFSRTSVDLAYYLDRDNLTDKHWLVGPMMEFAVKHPLIAKCLMGLVLVTMVFVTWVKYLVPYARIGKAAHNYLQAAEDFGCNKMNPVNAEEVANNMVRQLCTTKDRKHFECPFKKSPYTVQEDKEDAGQKRLYCEQCKRWADEGLDEGLEALEDDASSESSSYSVGCLS